MESTRQEIAAAILSRDQERLVAAMARYQDPREAAEAAEQELRRANTATRDWWLAPEPEPNCDGINCHHDHKLVAAGVVGVLQAELARRGAHQGG